VQGCILPLVADVLKVTAKFPLCSTGSGTTEHMSHVPSWRSQHDLLRVSGLVSQEQRVRASGSVARGQEPSAVLADRLLPNPWPVRH
jgi:hypothetical protein